MIRDYIKITEQDLKLAEDFFENDKHFNEWLVNVVRYYRGNKVEIKTKIVQKYFNNYKKTMDYILNSIGTGKKGAEVKAEKQAVKEDTLEGVVKPSLEPSLEPNIETVIENNKIVKEEYKAYVKSYSDFFQDKVGLPIKMDGSEGKAMKSIISYMNTATKDKGGNGLLGWDLVLQNFDKWDNFHKTQLTIKQINSNLPNILNSIRNGKSISSKPEKGQSIFRT
jgi:hypothetical protein